MNYLVGAVNDVLMMTDQNDSLPPRGVAGDSMSYRSVLSDLQQRGMQCPCFWHRLQTWWWAWRLRKVKPLLISRWRNKGGKNRWVMQPTM